MLKISLKTMQSVLPSGTNLLEKFQILTDLGAVDCNPSDKYETWHGQLFLSFFFFLIGTRSLRMPALWPASQAGQTRNHREGTSVVLRDTIRLT